MAGTLVIDQLKASSGVLATQNGMTGIAKAWVNYNGSTQTIASSFNISSVVRTGTGAYTVNFSTAMPNANYSGVVTAGIGSTGANFATAFDTDMSLNTVSAFSVRTGYLNTSGSSVAGDRAYISVAVFGA